MIGRNAMRKRYSPAFTLIELLVVIAILAILISLLAPSLSQARDLARMAACASNLHSCMLGIRVYATDHGTFNGPGNWNIRHKIPNEAARCPSTPDYVRINGRAYRTNDGRISYAMNAYPPVGSAIIGYGMCPWKKNSDGDWWASRGGLWHAKKPEMITNPNFLVLADEDVPGRGYHGILKPFHRTGPVYDDSANANLYGAGCGFYHLGERFTWPSGGGTGVRDGINQSVRWDGGVRKLQALELWDDWFRAPNYSRHNQGPNGSRW